MNRPLDSSVLAAAPAALTQPPVTRRAANPRRAYLALLVLVALAFANSFNAGLVLDNQLIIGADPRIRAATAENLRLIFEKDYWWPSLNSDLYRPVTTLSYLFNYAVLGGGSEVAGYHAVNLLLHALNACFVFALLRKLTFSPSIAWRAAAIFAVHPVTTEAVTNIVGRADLLATLSVLAGYACYLRAAEAERGTRVRWLTCLAVTTCLGVFAKESAAAIGPLLIVHDWLVRWPTLPPARFGPRLGIAAREFGLKGYTALVPAFVLFVVARSQLAPALVTAGQSFVDNPIAHASWLAGFMTAVQVIGRYVGLLVFPRTLSADYSYNQIPVYSFHAASSAHVLTWASLALLITLGWLVLRWRKKHPVVAWGIAVFFVMLLPTSNLIVPIGSIMAERFLYLPLIGFALIASLALHAVVRAFALRTAVSLALSALLIASLALRTIARNADWQDELTLWRRTIAASPYSFKAHAGYARALWESGRDERAVDAALERASIALAILDRPLLSIERRDQTLYDALGHFHRAKGEFVAQRGAADDARRHFSKSAGFFERAIEVNRWNCEARRQALVRRLGHEIFEFGDPRIREQLAMTYLQLAEWEKLSEIAREIQKYAPGAATGYLLGGTAAMNLRQLDDAAGLFIAGLVLQPANETIFQNLTACYRELGAQPSPVSQDPSGLRLDTGHPLVWQHINRAFALLVRTHTTAGHRLEAAALRETARARFGVPAGLLTDGPPP